MGPPDEADVDDAAPPPPPVAEPLAVVLALVVAAPPAPPPLDDEPLETDVPLAPTPVDVEPSSDEPCDEDVDVAEHAAPIEAAIEAQAAAAGELDKARAILSSSTTFLEQRGLTDDAALGHLELARLATKGGEAQGASRELAAARRHADATERPDVRLEVALASAVETAGRSAADGAKALAAVQAEAERIGFVFLALRAQLEKARWSAKPDASGLQALSAKARELGLLSLADSADKLAASR